MIKKLIVPNTKMMSQVGKKKYFYVEQYYSDYLGQGRVVSGQVASDQEMVIYNKLHSKYLRVVSNHVSKQQLSTIMCRCLHN